MSCFIVQAFYILLLVVPVVLRTECVQVVGSLVCPSNPELARGVRLDLRDEDSLPWEIDDQMGRTWSTSNGSFILSGCGADFGPINTPDPYVFIDHMCPSVIPGQSIGLRSFALLKIFLPKVLTIGKVYLDDSKA